VWKAKDIAVYVFTAVDVVVSYFLFVLLKSANNVSWFCFPITFGNDCNKSQPPIPPL
jgi:hypothetical protein